jgi:hypothetical protein
MYEVLYELFNAVIQFTKYTFMYVPLVALPCEELDPCESIVSPLSLSGDATEDSGKELVASGLMGFTIGTDVDTSSLRVFEAVGFTSGTTVVVVLVLVGTIRSTGVSIAVERVGTISSGITLATFTSGIPVEIGTVLMVKLV